LNPEDLVSQGRFGESAMLTVQENWSF